jgi:protein SCO1
MTPENARRPSPRLLLALFTTVAVLSGGLVVVAIAGRGAGDGEPVAIVEEKDSQFRGNVLPDGIDKSPAADFRLQDARGGMFGTDDVAGKPYVVTFLYVNCDDVCPVIAQELRLALERLGRRADDVAVLGVSADPKGDTAEAVRLWLDRHRLPDNFHYLIGSRAELKPVWDAYYAAPQSDTYAERGDHSASIWMVDAEDRLRTKYSAGAPVPPGDVAHDFMVLLREADRGSTAERASQ